MHILCFLNAEEIKHLRQAGLSYRQIAEELSKFGGKVSFSTILYFHLFTTTPTND